MKYVWMIATSVVAITLTGCAYQHGGTRISVLDPPQYYVAPAPPPPAGPIIYYTVPPPYGVVTYYGGPGVVYWNDHGQRRYYRHH